MRRLSLEERLARFGADGLPLASADLECARARFGRWRDEIFGGREELFRLRLASIGLEPDRVLPYLVCPAESSPLRSTRSSDAWIGHASRAIEEHLERLARASTGLEVDVRSVLESIVTPIRELVDRRSRPALVRDLRRRKIAGDLVGATPRERWLGFVRGESGRVLGELPVLERALDEAADRAVRAFGELVERLAGDLERLRDRFALPARDRLVGVEARLRELHRGGRFVARLRLASGSDIVYKPRPPACEARYQDLVAWLGERWDGPELRTQHLLDRGAYGWFEFVREAPCSGPAGAGDYHRRLGAQLALAHLLAAIDLHMENVVASGDHPFLVDLETILQPAPRLPPGTRPADLETAVLTELVAGTRLLPTRFGGPLGSVDIGGTSGRGQERFPFPVPKWESEGTDEVRQVEGEVILPPAANLPRLGGARLGPEGHEGELLEGFESAYRLFVRRREELGRRLAGFAGAPVRWPARTTGEYVRVLDESFAPEYLADAIDRDFLIDVLWLGVERRPHLAPIVPSETRQLLAGDVPIFTVRADSRDLDDPSGAACLGFFERSGLERALDRLGAMGEDDLERQVHAIRASISTLREDVRGAAPLETARDAGRRLSSLAVHVGDEAHWGSVLELPDGRRRFGLAGPGFAAGTMGVSLFLARLARATGDVRPAALAGAALRGALRELGLPGEVGTCDPVDLEARVGRALSAIGGDDPAGVLAAVLARKEPLRPAGGEAPGLSDGLAGEGARRLFQADAASFPTSIRMAGREE